MLQFLQTGKVLYVLAAFCVIGTISKLVTGNLYKRLIKETGNMALTKNKNLRTLKQKTENLFLVSHGVRNPEAYIEKQLYDFSFLKLSLNNWDHLAVQTMILSFMIGGIAAFGAYWYRCDSYYIVLYGTMGILSGLFMVLVDNMTNVSGKRQHLVDCLIDYVENSPHFYRNVDKSQESMETERKGVAEIRDIRRKDNVRRIGKSGMEKVRVSSEKENDGELREERQGGRLSVLTKKKALKEEAIQPAAREDELTKSIDYLKQSLEQIAAGREQERAEKKSEDHARKTPAEQAKRELKPEQIKLLSEILTEYLS